MTAFIITFDEARPTRRSAAATQCGYSVIEDDGSVTTADGKTYNFYACRIFDKRAAPADRVTWEVELQQRNGRRLPATALVEARKEVLSLFKARIQDDNAAKEAAGELSPLAAQARGIAKIAQAEQQPKADLEHVVVYHHADAPSIIDRVIVSGAADRDQAAAQLLANTFSPLVILSAHVLDEGKRFQPVADALPWVEVPANRRAPYITDAWSQVPAFGQGRVSISCYADKPGFVLSPTGEVCSTLEDAKAAAQAFHDATPIVQIIELREHGYGHTDYLHGHLVDTLADCNNISKAEVVERILAGEDLRITGLFSRGDKLVRETLKLVRLVRAPTPPKDDQEQSELDRRNATIAAYAASRNAISTAPAAQAERELPLSRERAQEVLDKGSQAGSYRQHLTYEEERAVQAYWVDPKACPGSWSYGDVIRHCAKQPPAGPFAAPPSDEDQERACRGLEVIDEADVPATRTVGYLPVIRELTWELCKDIAERNGFLSPHQVLKALKSGQAVYTTFRRFYLVQDIELVEKPEWMEWGIALALTYRTAQAAQERFEAARAQYVANHAPKASQEAPVASPERSCA